MRGKEDSKLEITTKTCPVCNVEKLITDFQLNPDGSIRKHVCKLCYGRKWRAQVKLEMLNALGRKCRCCGETNPLFLTLDHVQNDGASHRASFKSTNVELIYQQAKCEGWPADKYQLLCMNCNFAKGHFGVCPHEEGKTPEMIYADLESRIFKTGKTYQNFNLEPLKLGPVSQRRPETTDEAIKRVTKLVMAMNPADLDRILGSLQQ